MTITELTRARESLATTLARRSADRCVVHNGFIELPADPAFLGPLVEKIRAGMVEITGDTKSHSHFPWHTTSVDCYGVDYGQENGLRLPKLNNNGEKKFVFQFSPEMIAMLQRSGVPLAPYREFFKALEGLGTWAQHIAVSVAEKFDETNTRERTYDGSLAERLRHGRWLVRVLRYLKREDSTEHLPDAKVHLDRSVFTIHAWTSHRGLQLFTPDGVRCGVEETLLNSVALFPGEKFAAITRGAFGYGTPHGVRDERSVEEREEDRFAIVAFVHPTAYKRDAAWLLRHKQQIEAYEARFSL